MKDVLKRNAPRLACMAAALAAAGCGSPIVRNQPGATFGEIHVGAPRVAGRERLINDRLDQEAWLKKQLDKTDEQTFGFSGLTDVRSLSYTGFQLRAQADPSYGIYALQQSRNARNLRDLDNTERTTADFLQSARQKVIDRFNRGEITAAQATEELKALGVTVSQTSVPGATPTTGANGAAATTPGVGNGAVPDASKPFQSTLLDAADAKDRLSAPKPEGIVQTDLTSTPIERLRDRLAYREEIRSELLENALDDRHDLAGNTLYRLTFDATVVPERDTSAWAVVDVAIGPHVAKDCKGAEQDQPSAHDPQQVFNDTRRMLERSINEQLERRFRLLSVELNSSACQQAVGSAEDRPEQAIECALKRLPPREQDSLLRAMDQLREDSTPNEADSRPSAAASSKGRGVEDNRVRLLSRIQRQKGSETETVASRLFKLLEKDATNQFPNTRMACFFTLQGISVDGGAQSQRSDAPDGPYFGMRVQSVSNRLPSNYEALASRLDCQGNFAQIASRIRQANPAQAEKLVVSAFYDNLSNLQRHSVYAVTPKETVQRLSEAASNRTARELLLGLSAVTSAAGVDAALQTIRVNDALAQAVRRQPLVVGLTLHGGSTENGAALGDPVSVAWLMGPQFKLTDDGKSSMFRHFAKQQSLTAVVSLPSWIKTAQVQVRSRWQREDGTAGGPTSCKDYSVDLPRRFEGIRATLDEVYARRPETDEYQQLQVVADKPARVLITGRNLWRNAQVYIGAQPASAVSVLPDMAGLTAEFEKVLAPFGSQRTSDSTLELTVITSEGRVSAGQVKIIDAAQPQPPALKVAGFGRKLVAGSANTIELSAPVGAFAGLAIVARSPQDALLNASITDLKVDASGQGRSIGFSIPATAVTRLTSGDTLDLALSIQRVPNGVPEVLPIAQNVVYFKSADDAKATASLVGNAKKLPADALVKFPRGVLPAHADLSDRALDLQPSVTLADGSKKLLNPVNCAIRDNQCRVRLDGDRRVLDAVNKATAGAKLQLEPLESDAPQFVTEPLAWSK